MNDDVRRRLEEAGRHPAPAPDPAFADELETRLRAVAVSMASAPPPARPPRRRTKGGRRLALGGALLAGVAGLAVLLAVAAGSGRPVVAPELTAPVNVEVALSDGTVLEDPDGLRLPEGAVVRVGTGGSARIGDTVLEPGDVATVEQGRLRVDHDQPIGEVPGATPTQSPRPAASRSPRPAATPRRAPSPTPTAKATGPAPTAKATPSPRPSRTPAPTGAPGTPTPPRTDPPPTPKPTAKPTIVRPKLRARVLFSPTRVRVTWTATPGAASYVLVTSRSRTGTAPRPRYPGGRILGEFSRPPATPLRFRVPNGVIQVKLVVVALRADGSVLARSRVVTLSTVPAATVPSPTSSPTSTVPAATGPATTDPTPTPAIGD